MHRRATFWLNGHEIGFHDGYLTPFAFDLTDAVSFDTENILTARVDNIYRGYDDDQTGCFDWIYNWGGIHRSVCLEATEPVWMTMLSSFLIWPAAGRSSSSGWRGRRERPLHPRFKWSA